VSYSNTSLFRYVFFTMKTSFINSSQMCVESCDIDMQSNIVCRQLIYPRICNMFLYIFWIKLCFIEQMFSIFIITKFVSVHHMFLIESC